MSEGSSPDGILAVCNATLVRLTHRSPDPRRSVALRPGAKRTLEALTFDV